MITIHPSAVVEPGAVLGDDVVVGPFCYVGEHVKIGAGTRLVSHVSVRGRTTIGHQNIIWPQATIGGDPQDLKYTGEPVFLEIGDHNEIRENVTIHLGTGNGGGITRVGSDNMFMVGAHIAHDCVIGNHILLANNVLLAGHVHVQDHANLAGAAAVHHYCTIGSYCYVGGITPVTKDVPPFVIYEGDPARERGINSIGLARHGFADDTIKRLKDCFKRLFRSDRITQVPTSNRRRWYAFKSWFGADPAGAAEPEKGGLLTFGDRLAAVEKDYADDKVVQQLCLFLRNRSVGLSGRYRESLRKDDRRKRGAAALAEVIPAAPPQETSAQDGPPASAA
jgi:UDP-N-acetylglucosamine acyltransferase